MSTGERALRNTFFHALHIGLQMGGGLVTAVIIARSLGPDATGKYNLALWLVGFLLIPAAFGVPNALTKYFSEYLGRGQREVASGLARYFWGRQSLIAVLVTIAGSAVIALWPGLADRKLLLLAMPLLLVTALREGVQGVLAGAQDYRRIAVMSTVGMVVQIAGVAAASLLRSGIEATLLAVLAANAAAGAAGAAAMRHIVGRRTPTLPPETKSRIWGFVRTSVWLSVFYAVLWQRFEVILLGRLSVAAEIAFFGIAYSVAEKLEALAQTFTAVLMPVSSERYGASQRDIAALGRVYQQSVRYVQMVIVPLCLLGIAIARPLAQLLFGEVFTKVGPVLQVVLLAVMFTTLGGVAWSLLYAAERERTILRLWMPFAALDMALATSAIPEWGALGAAAAKAVAQTSCVLVALMVLGRIVNARFPWNATLRIYLAAMLAAAPAMVAAYLRAPESWLLVLALAGAVIYIPLLRVFGAWTAREARLLRSIFERPASRGDLPGSAASR